MSKLDELNAGTTSLTQAVTDLTARLAAVPVGVSDADLAPAVDAVSNAVTALNGIAQPPTPTT